MPSHGFPTTAENVIGATQVALLCQAPVTEQQVSDFLDVPTESARSALAMAVHLGLLKETKSGNYSPSNPLASYLLAGPQQSKAAILRLVLEQYPPYRTFKQRLPHCATASEAANHARAIHGIQAHREEILNTFIGLGTYANSLTSQGGGAYAPIDASHTEYLQPLAEAIASREATEAQVRRHLGAQAADWINREEILDPLILAYQSLARVGEDARAPILHAGNAVESFLVQLAGTLGVSLKGATGINKKAHALLQAGKLTAKHAGMLTYLGHVRNASDHGTDIDPDVNHTWDISLSTSLEYVHVAMSTISAVIGHQNGHFVV